MVSPDLAIFSDHHLLLDFWGCVSPRAHYAESTRLSGRILHTVFDTAPYGVTIFVPDASRPSSPLCSLSASSSLIKLSIDITGGGGASLHNGRGCDVRAPTLWRLTTSATAGDGFWKSGQRVASSPGDLSRLWLPEACKPTFGHVWTGTFNDVSSLWPSRWCNLLGRNDRPPLGPFLHVGHAPKA